MKAKPRTVAVLIGLTLMGIGLIRLHPVVLADAASGSGPMQMEDGDFVDQGIPSYHAYAPTSPLPATANPKQFLDALNRNVYRMAEKIKPVLFQQPCYCYCDRHLGHKSLLDCFVSHHAAVCNICRKELVYAYQESKMGKSAPQIRAGIIRGDWKKIDLHPYLADMTFR
jgi:Protein of unknown function with PCYCGC motif